MEFKDLITEEPAMDKEIEMQRINEEVSTPDFPKPRPTFEEVSTSVQEDATTGVQNTAVGDAHLQVEIPTTMFHTPVVTNHTQVFQDVKDISVDNTKELAETTPQTTTMPVSELPNCRSLQNIYKLGGQGRTAHYKDSYPWSKDGGRVIPNEDVIEYIKKFSGIKNEFDKEVIQFIEHDYDNAVIDEQARLQGDNDTLFNRSDYPDKEELRKLFNLSIEVEQLHSDWRTDIEDEGHEVVSDFFRDQHKERMKKFTDEVLKDTVTHITKLAESLDYRGESTTTNPDYKSWQASAFEHVERMITVLDRFNLDGNSEMQVARNKLHAQISGRGITAGMLKSSESLRVETKQTIDEVLAALPSLNQ